MEMFHWNIGVFYVHYSHRYDSNTAALTSRGALRPHECSHQIVVRNTAGSGKVAITQQHIEHLVGLMVTHPSTNQAHDCLTSVIKHDVLAPS